MGYILYYRMWTIKMELNVILCSFETTGNGVKDGTKASSGGGIGRGVFTGTEVASETEKNKNKKEMSQNWKLSSQ